MGLASGFPLLARGLSAQRAALIGRSPASAAGTCVSWSPPSPSLQEDPSGVLPEPQEPTSSPALANKERAPCSNGTDMKTEMLEGQLRDGHQDRDAGGTTETDSGVMKVCEYANTFIGM